MIKSEFVQKVTDLLKENDVRKPVSIKKAVFHITDDNGNRANFNVKQADKMMQYTHDDVNKIVDACLAIIEDNIKHGEPLQISGYGTLGVKWRAARKVKQLGTERWLDIEERIVPNFKFGNKLRMAARVFEKTQEDLANVPKVPDPIYDGNDI